jgi:hypothetical protein
MVGLRSASVGWVSEANPPPLPTETIYRGALLYQKNVYSEIGLGNVDRDNSHGSGLPYQLNLIPPFRRL